MMSSSSSPRLIPAIERLRKHPVAADLELRYGHDAVIAALREEAADLRSHLVAVERSTTAVERAADVIAEADPGPLASSDLPATEDEAARLLVAGAAKRLAVAFAPSLRPVINATGVVVHTNLGRAPLADRARERIAEVASRYSTLEYDVAAGERGRRDIHAEHLVTRLTGAEAAVVVNNNAAATLLMLTALARGGEVLISRGELVEIGGGFRVPDVMAQSGAVLREVGTTNRTRVSDYAAAITERTVLILRVHPSNFTMEGFTERPDLPGLAALARERRIPLAEDLGSGFLGLGGAEHQPSLAGEPSVSGSLSAGVDILCFSGDKLLGGPQAGILAGRQDLIAKVRQHPLMRALRVDKLTYAALEGTLMAWLAGHPERDVPVMRMIVMSREQIRTRAEHACERLRDVQGLRTVLVDGYSAIGGGSAPGSQLPTALVAVERAGLSAAQLEERLRLATTPVIARIEDDRVLIDLRTVHIDEEDTLIEAIKNS
jgi:L-seryl-tRNA(Ser) seleniumtransferase